MRFSVVRSLFCLYRAGFKCPDLSNKLTGAQRNSCDLSHDGDSDTSMSIHQLGTLHSRTNDSSKFRSADMLHNNDSVSILAWMSRHAAAGAMCT